MTHSMCHELLLTSFAYTYVYIQIYIYKDVSRKHFLKYVVFFTVITLSLSIYIYIASLTLASLYYIFHA